MSGSMSKIGVNEKLSIQLAIRHYKLTLTGWTNVGEFPKFEELLHDIDLFFKSGQDDNDYRKIDESMEYFKEHLND